MINTYYRLLPDHCNQEAKQSVGGMVRQPPVHGRLRIGGGADEKYAQCVERTSSIAAAIVSSP